MVPGNHQVEFKHWQFPGGECGVLLDLDKIHFNVPEFLIRWNYEGDSITLEVAKDILERLEKKGFASCNVVFGIGSFTYQYIHP